MKQRQTYLLIYGMVICLIFFVVSEGNASDLEINELIMDQTQTHAGREFFEYFSQIWESPHGITDYNITIHERATAQWGDWVWVEVAVGFMEGQTVFKSVIKPNTPGIEEKAREAVLAARAYLIRFRRLKNQVRGLEKDLKGNGL